ncbi:MAG: DUF4330 family protein [Candidatus Omnitrophota bacterium]
MKIIDENGRLFGKLNIIDFLIIVSLICFITMFYFGYRLFSAKPKFSKKDFIEEVFDCQFIKLEPQIAKLISVGDKELNESGEVIGEIISLGEVGPYEYKIKVGPKEEFLKTDKNLKQISARLKLIVGVRPDGLYYKYSPIALNSIFDFATEKYSVKAIRGLKNIEESLIDLYGSIKELNNDTAKLVLVGDKEVDENGQVIAEILNVGELENNIVNIDLGSGNFLQGVDPNRKQIFVKVRLKCKTDENSQIFYKDRKLTYNFPIEFNTDKYKSVFLASGAFSSIYQTKTRWLKLKVRFFEIIPEIADIIHEGDVEKDLSGQVVAKIDAVISSKQSEMLTFKENNLVMVNHPFLKEIVVSMKTFCAEKDEITFFKNFPVKIGNPITFSTDMYSISGIIVGVEP